MVQAFGAHGGSVVSEGRMSLRLSKRIFISNLLLICLLPFLFLLKRNVAWHPGLNTSDTRVSCYSTPGCQVWWDPGVVQVPIASKEVFTTLLFKIHLYRHFSPFYCHNSPTSRLLPKPHHFQANRHLTFCWKLLWKFFMESCGELWGISYFYGRLL